MQTEMRRSRILDFVVFPGFWLLGIAALCITQIPHAWAVASALGIAAYALNMARRLYRHKSLKWGRAWLSVVMVGVIVVISAIVIPLTYLYATSQPIGERTEYDAFNGVCARNESAVPSADGTVAMLRQVECTGAPIIPPTRDYFVFIHRVGASDSRANLVLRYREGSDDADWVTAPRLTWKAASSLSIAIGVPTTMFNYPTMMRTDIGGTRVTYSVGKGGLKIRNAYQFQSEKGWRNF